MLNEIKVPLPEHQLAAVKTLLNGLSEKDPNYLVLRVGRKNVIGTPAELRSLASAVEGRGLMNGSDIVRSLNEAADKADPFPHLANRAMARKLAKGEAVDLSEYRGEDGTYLLPAELNIEDVDLCDAKLDRWIWSVGRNLKTGERWAALDGRYYEVDGWKCEWLR